jgi:hypothetical protein
MYLTHISVNVTEIVSPFQPVLRKDTHTAKGDTISNVQENRNADSTASKPAVSDMHNMHLRFAPSNPAHNQESTKVQSMPQTHAQEGNEGFEVMDQMTSHETVGDPAYVMLDDQRYNEPIDTNVGGVMHYNASTGHVERPEVPMSKISSGETVDNDGHVFYKLNRQKKSKMRSSKGLQTVPSIPEVFTVLGYSMASQLAQAEDARTARVAETVELKATIAKLEFHVSSLLEQRAKDLEKEKKYTKHMQDYKARALKSQKFLAGLSHDVERERTRNKELRGLIQDVQVASAPALSEYNSATEDAKVALDQLKVLKEETFMQVREALSQSRQLENEKAQLESQIQLQAQELRSLTHERNQIKSQLEQRAETSIQLDNLLNTNRDVLLEKLTELATTFEGVKGAIASDQTADIVSKIEQISSISPDAGDSFRHSMLELESR